MVGLAVLVRLRTGVRSRRFSREILLFCLESLRAAPLESRVTIAVD
jgi:hypothetical protein